jgi:copper transport protein
LALGLLAIVLGVLAFTSGVAHAENTVVTSSPEDGAVLAESPAEITITFADELGDANTIALECETELVTLPRPEVDDAGTTLSVAIAEPLSRGTCVARWRVSNPDGEPDGSGAITFVIQGEASTTTVPQTTSPDSPTTTLSDSADGSATDLTAGEDEIIALDQVDTATGPLWLGRLLSTLGLAALFGSLIVIAAAWPEGVEYLIAVRFARGMWLVALLGTVLYTAAAAGAVNGESLGAGLNPATWIDLWDAGWDGRALLVRLVLVVASAWVAFRPDRVIDPTTQTVALVIPALAVATIGISRTEGSLVLLGVAMGIIHALAMAVWVGGVILVARVVLAGPGEEDLVHAVRGFCRLSNPAIIATVATGIVLMVRLDGGDLFSSSHGRVVLLKATVVAVMLFVAMSARQFVSNRLARVNEMSVPMSSRLRRAFGVEALFGLAALALSAWLLALDPPNIDSAPQIDYAIQHEIVVDEADLEVTVKLTNKTVGRAGLEVDVDRPDSGMSNLEVIFTAPPNEQNIGTITQPVPLTGAGVAVRLEINGLPLNFAGDWTMEVSAVTQSGAVRSEPWQFTLVNEDGSVPTTAITLPPASTVVVTTVPAEE